MVKIGGSGGGGGGGGGDQIFLGGTIYFSWKRGDEMFQRGTDFFQKILVPPDHFFLKYLVRGDCFWGT